MHKILVREADGEDLILSHETQKLIPFTLISRDSNREHFITSFYKYKPNS